MTQTTGQLHWLDWSSEDYAAYGTRGLRTRHGYADDRLMSDQGLIELLDAMPRNEIQAFTMGTDPERAGDWKAVHTGGLDGAAMLECVRRGRLWINLLWVERFHDGHAQLLDHMYTNLRRHIPRLESARHEHSTVLISSPTAQVYCHFDVEDNMLWHMRGEKTFYVYDARSRADVPIGIQEDIFARQSVEDIPYESSFDDHASVFDLTPGDTVSFHHNTPHRVVNRSDMNVSISTSVITDLSERRQNLMMANRLLRAKTPMKRLALDETGLSARAKTFTYRVARKLGAAPPENEIEFATDLVLDADAEQGVRRLDRTVHTDFCNVKRAPALAT